METGSTRERIWRYAPLIFWMALIFFASSNEFSAINTSRVVRPLLLWLFPNITEESIRLAHVLVRKAAHITEYAILGWLAARAFTGSSREFLRQRWFLAGLLLIVLHSLLDEYHQSLVPSRTGSLYDSGIDIAGGLIGLIGFAYSRCRAAGSVRTRFIRP
ncbi:MAG TPA: VanZ family protein [Pyrinomonadaceae bacterium]|nr:VanZ family protein [Pyrinomonadaceae bacterium]